jgi:UDP-glucuronate decarboxylase
VDDTIDAILQMANLETAHSTPINVGNPHEITMKELSQKILELTKSKSQVKYHPLPQDDPRQRCPDISLAREVLDWSPLISLTDGLSRTAKYFEDLINAPNP